MNKKGFGDRQDGPKTLGPFRGIQWHIMLRQMPLLLILFVGVLYWLESHLKEALYTTNLELARRTGLMTVSATQASMKSAETHRVWERVEQNISPEGDTSIEIVNVKGQVLYATDPEMRGRVHHLTDASCVPCHVGGSKQATERTKFIQGSKHGSNLVFVAPLRNTENCQPCHANDGPKLGMVYVALPLKPVNRLILTTQMGLVIAGAIALVLTVLTTRILLGRYLGRPLKRLVAGAQAIGSGNLELRIQLHERTELAVLADTLNSSAKNLLETIRQVEQQRDDLQTLYYIADQLGRSVQPEERRRRALEMAHSIFKSECLLIAGTFHHDTSFEGTLTYCNAESDIIERPLTNGDGEVDAPFYAPQIVNRWLKGELDGETRVLEGSTVAYPLERRGQRLGLIMAPAWKVDESTDGRDTAANPQVVQALCKHLAIMLELSELQREFMRQTRLAAIGETVAMVSHCLKNILNGLRGGQYVVERAIQKDDHEKLQQGWKILTNGVRHIERLTMDMLYYAGERTLKREPVNPNHILREVFDLLKETASSQGVELREDFDEEIEPLCLDRIAIYRAVLNMATNAIDACGESETRDNTVILRSRSRPEEIVLTIEDNGAGMSETILKRLFDRFFTTKASKGTGLGLPVVKKIAEEHGGKIEVESELGLGSAFHLRLPKKQEEA